MARICQETKPHADVGWVMEFGIPDDIIPVGNGDVLLRYGNILVDLNACSDGITYEQAKEVIGAYVTEREKGVSR